ncbi:hypothetical protein B5M45_08625 [Mycobacterium simiae]|uniref:Uncharacterized protein n=1 Tax=Mycobacterium simiae TaxID=1784 RepID=A0A1X0Y9L7_MYCSI|nr:hypothetical protein B5M45_08625 [Mycobacterium simiae]
MSCQVLGLPTAPAAIGAPFGGTPPGATAAAGGAFGGASDGAWPGGVPAAVGGITRSCHVFGVPREAAGSPGPAPAGAASAAPGGITRSCQVFGLPPGARFVAPCAAGAPPGADPPAFSGGVPTAAAIAAASS